MRRGLGIADELGPGLATGGQPRLGGGASPVAGRCFSRWAADGFGELGVVQLRDVVPVDLQMPSMKPLSTQKRLASPQD